MEIIYALLKLLVAPICVVLFLCPFPNVEAASKSTEPARVHRYLIFIPGYYGSLLRDEESDSTIFINLKRAIFGSDQLFVGPTNSSSRSLKVDGILTRVTVVPGLYSIDGYGESFDIVQRNAARAGIPRENVLAFAYDWRQDPISILKEFDRFLATSISQPQDQVEISIVAHSMGAWLMSYWFRYGSTEPGVAIENWSGMKRIRRAALIAAPYRGTLSVFRNSFWGAPGLPSPSLLSAEVISSFPSTFYLMPSSTETIEAHGRKRLISLHDTHLWLRSGWSLLQFPQLLNRFTADELHGFVRYHLETAKLFSDKLHAPVQHPPHNEAKTIVVIQGRGFPTNELAYVVSTEPLRLAFTRDQIRQFTLDRFETDVDGDETVSVPSGEAPLYFQQLAAHFAAASESREKDQASASFSFEQFIFKKKHLELLKSPRRGFYEEWLNK